MNPYDLYMAIWIPANTSLAQDTILYDGTRDDAWTEFIESDFYSRNGNWRWGNSTHGTSYDKGVLITVGKWGVI